MSTAYRIRRRFLPGAAGELYLTEYLPDTSPQCVVLIVPPFAEEMNRARRMLGIQARKLAERGVLVCQPDLFGTGDSDGDFEQATWQGWIEDLKTSVKASAPGQDGVVVLALRLGALLAADAVKRSAVRANRMIFWSPCIDGSLFINQFLRLRRMAGMLTRSGDKESVADLRALLASGQSLEVAGYSLSPPLVAAIEALQLSALVERKSPPIDWIEVVADAARPLSPLVRRTREAIAETGVAVQTVPIAGPPFWTTAEISVADEVLDATTSLIVNQKKS